MLRHITIGFVSAMAAFLTYVAMQPAAYTVARQTTIAAPADAIFPHVNNLKAWEAWSPWTKKDPAAKHVYAGPESGVGAQFTWAGNREVGAGTMTIVESQPQSHVGLMLDFTEPMAGRSNVALDLFSVGGGTNVTWTIRGENGFISRAIMMAMGVKLDKMIGDEYEQGLANLKALVEGQKKG